MRNFGGSTMKIFGQHLRGNKITKRLLWRDWQHRHRRAGEITIRETKLEREIKYCEASEPNGNNGELIKYGSQKFE